MGIHPCGVSAFLFPSKTSQKALVRTAATPLTNDNSTQELKTFQILFCWSVITCRSLPIGVQELLGSVRIKNSDDSASVVLESMTGNGVCSKFLQATLQEIANLSISGLDWDSTDKDVHSAELGGFLVIRGYNEERESRKQKRLETTDSSRDIQPL